MSGNAYEWCWDLYGSYSSTARTDPTGPASGTSRVLRGGAYNSPYYGTRCTIRYPSTADFKNKDLGFRVARRGG